MHIVMIFSTQLQAVDGIAHHVRGLAERLRCRGHQVTLVTRGGRQRLRRSRHQGFTLVEVPFVPLYPCHVYLHGAFMCRPLVNLWPPPDIVHLHTPLVPPVPRLWPIVTTFHTPMLVDTAYVENIGLNWIPTSNLSTISPIPIKSAGITIRPTSCCCHRFTKGCR